MKRKGHIKEYNNDIAGYGHLIEDISGIYLTAQTKTARAVNANLLDAYWQIGKYKDQPE